MDEQTKMPQPVASDLDEPIEFDENGVNLTLIRENLKLSPAQRLLRGVQRRREALRQMEINRQQIGDEYPPGNK
jgi:hypothetical protein